MGQAAIHILFVCSGNTCRSPMAAAITRHFAQSRSNAMPTIEVDSAGAGAIDGLPATPEAGAALRSLGIEPGEHRSKALTPELIAWADRIYCMTPGHVAGVRSIAPNSDVDVELLDPSGESVPDPIGGSQRVYDDAARKLADLIATRLKELDQ
jgi:protein-tyrosine phosphatase